MNQLKTNHKLLKFVLIFALFSMLLLLLLIFFNREKSFDELAEGLSEDQCITIVESNIVGKWSFTSGDYDTDYEIFFAESQEFDMSAYISSKKYDESGKWKFLSENNSIQLEFQNNNKFWNDVINKEIDNSNDLEDLGIVSFNNDKKLIAFSVHYLPDNIWIGCEKDRYYLNLLNNLIYKVDPNRKNLEELNNKSSSDCVKEIIDYMGLTSWSSDDLFITFTENNKYWLTEVIEENNDATKLAVNIATGKYDLKGSTLNLEVSKLNPDRNLNYNSNNFLTREKIKEGDEIIGKVKFAKEEPSKCNLSQYKLTILNKTFEID